MSTIEQAAPPQAKVLRVRFTESAQPGARVLMTFQEPCARVAVCEAMPPIETGPAAETVSALRPAADELLVVHVEPAAQPQWRSQVEQWTGVDEATATVRPAHLKVEGGVVFWRPGVAVVQGSAECLEMVMAALVDFAFYEGELRKLEREVAADWPKAEADVPLVHHVAKAELARSERVGAMTALVVQRRLRCARLSGRVVQPPASLSEAARKLACRLREAADMEKRLELVDGQIEVYEYQYEMINQRISDYSHFRHEYIVEIVIVVLLAAEVVAMAMDFVMHWMQ